MGMLDEILTHNAQYVATRQYEALQTDKFPDKGLAVLACMDARLVELLPQWRCKTHQKRRRTRHRTLGFGHA